MGHSRSMKVTSVDRSYTTSYQSFTVTIASFSGYLTLNNIMTLKSRKWHHSIDPGISSCWRSIVGLTISCIISEIKRDIGRKSRFIRSKTPGMGSLSEYYRNVCTET